MRFHPSRSIAAFLMAAVLAAASVADIRAQSTTRPATARDSALALEQQGKWPEAQKAWRAIAEKNPRSAEPWVRIASIEARLENYDGAISAYRKAISLDSSNGALQLNLGLALFKSSRFPEAAQAFEAAQRLLPPRSPEAERISVLLGMTYYGSGRYADAVPPLREAAAKDARNLPLRLTLAHSCLWSRQYECVLDTYREILSLNAESAEADMLAGEALDEMKDAAGSVKMFRAAATANPRQPNVHFGLGYLLWRQKQFEEAAAEFRAELANDPRHGQALVYLGDSYIELGKPEEARSLLEQAIQVEPEQWRAHLDLGIVNAGAARNDDALRSFEEAARLNPGEVNVHWRLGRLYRSMGRTEDSKKEFDLASRLTRNADGHSSGASAHAQDGANTPEP